MLCVNKGGRLQHFKFVSRVHTCCVWTKVGGSNILNLCQECIHAVCEHVSESFKLDVSTCLRVSDLSGHVSESLKLDGNTCLRVSNLMWDRGRLVRLLLKSANMPYTTGGQRRPPMGVLVKCELSMGAPAGNNQAQYPENVCLPAVWTLFFTTNFHSRPPTLPNHMIFGVIESSFINKHHCKRNGVKRSTIWGCRPTYAVSPCKATYFGFLWSLWAFSPAIRTQSDPHAPKHILV